ncbi:MAG: dihydrodipicolinate synthase family protein [Rhodospirillales bacterium]|nr:dihydrodipicolinate synthase family protein [Rhodospirillales bacterium]
MMAKSKEKRFRGSYTVTFTPFTEDGKAINTKMLRRFIDWQIDEGSHGLIALGSVGQFLSITQEERTQIIETYVDQVKGRVPVLIGTTHTHTPTAVRYAKEAERLGADGVMITPPYYYWPTDEEIFEYYKQISEAISIPIMLYNNPIVTHIDMSAKFVAHLAKELPNIRYIKEASGEGTRVYDVVRESEGLMTVFAGGRPYESFIMGAPGYVSPPANHSPRQSALMMDAMAAGDLATGKLISDKYSAMLRVVKPGHPTYGHGTYGRNLTKVAGFDLGEVRPPLTPLSKLGADGQERMAKLTKMWQDIRQIGAKRAAAE